MKIKGRGQAKILSQEEINLFWTKGFLCARDRTLYQICYYLACRIGEARQLLYSDIFDHQRRVKESIVLRKNITKGKQASRTIPTNPKLASTLYKYIEESVDELKNKTSWPTWSELQSSAIVVLIAAAIISLIIYLMDSAFGNVMKVIYNNIFN